MSIKCLMNGLEVNHPCSPVCALFGDCVTAFEAQKKANVRTNADRIRAMSYEELAQMLKRQGCPPSEHFSCYDKTCKECWFEWLQQPAGDAEQERPKATGSPQDGFGAHIARRFGSEV